jgi:hypothetical protein
MEITFKGSLSEFRALFQGMSPAFEPSSLADLENADAIRIEHKAPLAVVPDAPAAVGPAAGWGRRDEGIPEAPENDASVGKPFKLPPITEEERAGALEYFQNFATEWVQGFEDEDADQPDRLQLMKDIGTCRWVRPILILAYEKRSLQRLVMGCLPSVVVEDFDSEEDYLDFIERVCTNMVAVSHKGLPDLAGTYDYSTKWKRS